MTHVSHSSCTVLRTGMLLNTDTTMVLIARPTTNHHLPTANCQLSTFTAGCWHHSTGGWGHGASRPHSHSQGNPMRPCSCFSHPCTHAAVRIPLQVTAGGILHVWSTVHCFTIHEISDAGPISHTHPPHRPITPHRRSQRLDPAACCPAVAVARLPGQGASPQPREQYAYRGDRAYPCCSGDCAWGRG